MSSAVSNVRPGSWDAWKMAFRPGTLWIAAVPVVVTSSWVFAQQSFIDPPPISIATIALAIVCSLIIQAITNMQNDVGYTQRGHEKPGERPGMPRATQLGVLTIKQVKMGIVGSIIVTLMLGVPLILWHGWVVLALGVASIAAAVLYMGGYKPIAFTAFGEFFVFVFFGLIAVNGTYYMLTHALSWSALCLSVAIGFLATAVLLVNNYRDALHDAQHGRATLAVVLGTRASQLSFAALIGIPFVLLIPFAALSLWFVLPLLALPFAVLLYRRFVNTERGLTFNKILLDTVRLEALYGLLFSVAGVLVGLF